MEVLLPACGECVTAVGVFGLVLDAPVKRQRQTFCLDGLLLKRSLSVTNCNQSFNFSAGFNNRAIIRILTLLVFQLHAVMYSCLTLPCISFNMLIK